MKALWLFWVLLIPGFADSVSSVWHITEENAIVSVEDMPADTIEEDIVTESEGVEDLPLAKTYPLQEAAPHQEVLSYKKGSDNIVKEEPRAEDPVKEGDSVPAQKLQMQRQSEVQIDYLAKGKQFLSGVYRQSAQQRYLLIAGLLSFVSLLFLLFRRKKRKRDAPASELFLHDAQWTRLLESFSRLQGEVHQQFIQRKQNILFNDDFTQYQKAKALIELEKEYTDYEHTYLPKLFSNDFTAFIEAERVLSSRPELHEIIREFIEVTMSERTFTKLQKEHILQNLKNNYRTTKHSWEYDETKMQHRDNEEKAFLLLQ